MKENNKLKAEIKKIQSNTDHSSEEDIENTEDEETLFRYKSKGYKQTNPQNNAILKCTVCKRTFIKERVLRKQMESHNEDGDWNCGDFECYFQTNCEDNLKAHMHKEHKTARPSPTTEIIGNNKSDSIKCYTCSKEFVYKLDLKKHITEAHMTYKPCRNAQSWTYAPRYRYNHKEYPEGHHVCYECGKSFKTIHELMKHRKSSHVVPMCKQFMKNKCDFPANECYNNHAKPKGHAKSVENVSTQGFWEFLQDTAPPVIDNKIQKGPTQAEWIQMKQALTQLNTMMQRFQ